MLLHRHLLKLQNNNQIFVVTEESSKIQKSKIHQPNIRLTDHAKNLFRRILFRIGASPLWFLFRAKQIEQMLAKIIRKQRPDLILTVWHGPFFLASACIAEKQRIPFVVLVHDDWEQMIPHKGFGRALLSQLLRRIYFQAKEVAFISKELGIQLEKRYGPRNWEVLPPIPSDQAFQPSFESRSLKPLRIGFFGELLGNIKVLEKVAVCLPEIDATLTFFSHGNSLERQALAAQPKVRDAGHANIEDLRRNFTMEMDVILITQSFIREHEALVRTCFPSKLPEACQFGLPLFVVAPSYGTSISWANRNLPSFCCCSSLEKAAIKDRLRQFQDRQKWLQAQKAVWQGRQAFDPQKIQTQLEKILSRAACL